MIRRVRPADLPELARLCTEHAAFEQAPFADDGLAERLGLALFAPPARLHAWVAEAEGAIAGYVTASREFSTWHARDFVHMDCLFLRETHRGRGLGAALLDVVADFAREQGIGEVQWQTPDWNIDATRFYRRRGAQARSKLRFTLEI
ncbi:MAG TPA: GNAT family N-acetyltransferase [Luteibacter sp.]|jgi:GNAT superfamily N-acetyltransferase|nr:GNAT family N-acetyltransferase [Luteibacter sp.]